MEKYHEEFIKQFCEFKKALDQQNLTNLKYLVCRLDFNEYYKLLEQKREFEEQNRARKGKGAS